MPSHHIVLYLLLHEENAPGNVKLHRWSGNYRRQTCVKQITPEGQQGPELYEIRIKGHLDAHWDHWFEGMTLTREANGDTLLTGPVVDQVALHGLLRKVRDLALPLVSVIHLDPTQASAPDAGADTHHNRANQKTSR
jgi:hypothetical protein